MKRLLLVVAALALASLALAADVQTGVATDYSTPVGGRTVTGKSIPLKATDGGHLFVYASDLDGGPVRVTGAVSVSITGVSTDGGAMPVTGAFWQAAQPVTGTDGGPVQMSSPDVPCWQRTFHQVGTCVSTGSTNNGALALTAGACIRYQPISAAYVGGFNAMLSDGGYTAYCLSLDGGSIPGCPLINAGAERYRQLGPTENNAACVSVSGTASVVFDQSNY
jgi:hypothetical protein